MNNKGTRCGTPSGWSAHKVAGEKPCDPCALAKQAYDKRWRAAPERTRQNRLRARAQQKAKGELARKYHTEYAALYRAALADLTASNGTEPTSKEQP